MTLMQVVVILSRTYRRAHSLLSSTLLVAFHLRARASASGFVFLPIGKVSSPPPTDKWKGHGKGHGKVRKGKKGSGRIDAGLPHAQPVYFGDDAGKVICTLAIGEDVKRIPATLPQNVYVDISSLMTLAGQLGVLHWTVSTTLLRYSTTLLQSRTSFQKSVPIGIGFFPSLGFACLHCYYTTALLHYCTTTLLHYYTTTLLH